MGPHCCIWLGRSDTFHMPLLFDGWFFLVPSPSVSAYRRQQVILIGSSAISVAQLSPEHVPLFCELGQI